MLAMALPVQHIMMWLIAYNYVKGTLLPRADALQQLPSPPADELPPAAVGRWAAIVRTLQGIWAGARELVNPPLLAIAAGLLIASCPPLKQAWTHPTGGLRWLAASIDRLGSAVVPISMMTLGSNLSEGPGEKMDPTPIAAMFAVRQLLMPVLGVLTAFFLHGLGVFPAKDALPPLVLMVLSSAPTANNMVTMATALGAGAAEISTCVFWQYVGFLVLQLVYIPLFVSVADRKSVV